MKITEKKGDLLEEFRNGNVDGIAHCCNCLKNMGGGIARQVREQFPQAWEADKNWDMPRNYRLGRFTYWTNEKDQTIFNAYGQFQYGGPPGTRNYDYEGGHKALEAIRRHIDFVHKDRSKVYKLGFPKLFGADRAKGNWNIILAHIQEVFKCDHIEIVIVEWEGK